MEVGFLDALAMIALRIGEPKQTLLQDIAAGESQPQLRLDGTSSIGRNLLLFIPEGKSDVQETVSI